MNLEFHYHITWLVAARAGLSPEDVRVLAYASQFTDDNNRIFTVDEGLPTAYRNYISQSMNILKPEDELFHIYPLFHFIPGYPQAVSAWRKDGAMHWLNTTPDSKNAHRVLDAALATGDLHRIGIACHGFADTWAHQNFAGYTSSFNAMEGPLSKAIPNFGHADVLKKPDEVALVWTDERLLMERVDNKARCLAAAARMFQRIAAYADPKMSGRERSRRRKALTNDLDRCIGAPQDRSGGARERIARYCELALSPEYGGRALDPYDPRAWMDEAVDAEVSGLDDRGGGFLSRLDPFRDRYAWKDRRQYRETHWRRFQEAVKAHQDETWEILSMRNFLGLDLPGL